MKRIVILSTALFLSTLVFAQKETTRNLSSFSEISAHEAIDVYIKSGNKEEARIKASNIDLEDVLTEVSGGRLKIHLEGNNHRNVKVEVWVTYKSISGLKASSAASIDGENEVNSSGDFDIDVSSAARITVKLKADDLEVGVSSAGTAELEFDVNSIEVNVSSAGDVEAKGSAKSQDISVSSSGDYDGIDVTSETVEASASSGGSIKVNVSERLNAKASSGGSIRYKGDPRGDRSSSSGGSIRSY